MLRAGCYRQHTLGVLMPISTPSSAAQHWAFSHSERRCSPPPLLCSYPRSIGLHAGGISRSTFFSQSCA